MAHSPKQSVMPPSQVFDLRALYALLMVILTAGSK